MQVAFGVFLIFLSIILVAPMLFRLLLKILKKEKRAKRKWTDPSDAAER